MLKYIGLNSNAKYEIPYNSVWDLINLLSTNISILSSDIIENTMNSFSKSNLLQILCDHMKFSEFLKQNISVEKQQSVSYADIKADAADTVVYLSMIGFKFNNETLQLAREEMQNIYNTQIQATYENLSRKEKFEYHANFTAYIIYSMNYLETLLKERGIILEFTINRTNSILESLPITQNARYKLASKLGFDYLGLSTKTSRLRPSRISRASKSWRKKK